MGIWGTTFPTHHIWPKIYFNPTVFPRMNVTGHAWLPTKSADNLHVLISPPCRIRSDRQTTSLTLTTGVCKAGTKMRGASNMNIHYDVIGLLTAAWRSDSGQIVWAAWINCELAKEEEGGGVFWTHSTDTGYPGSAGGRQLDRWRCNQSDLLDT